MTDIVTPPTIGPMPPAPLATDTQADFNTKAFATVAAFPAFIDEANALADATNTNATAAHERAASAQASASTAGTARDQAQESALTAINAPGTSGASTTSMVTGAGSKSFTTQPAKAWVVGQAVVIARTSAPVATRMYGLIDAYDDSSGAMSVQVPAGAFTGSGTFTDWTISLTAARDGLAPLASPAFTGTPTSPTPSSADNSLSLINTAWAKLGFSFSGTANGHLKFPDWLGGLIVQWGSMTNTASASSTTNFPIAFSVQCYAVIHVGMQATGNQQAYTTLNSIGSTSFLWNGFSATGGSVPSLSATAGQVQGRFIAVGK